MTNNQILNGKIALITGSGRGIGKAIAIRLAQSGAHIVINFIHNREPAEQVASQIREMGQKALVVRANVGKVDQLTGMFDEIEKEFSGLDILISNAASGFNRPGLQQKPEGWDHTMSVNAKAFLFAAQQAVPLMEKRGGGVMVAISSPGSVRVMPDYIAVGASKAALESLVRYLAVELAPKNIVINAVSPGVVITDALKHFQIFSNEDLIDRVAKATPAGRLVTPEDIANLVHFLCLPEAFMIRGQVIVIDGGLTLPITV